MGEPLKDFLFEQYDEQRLSFREIAALLSRKGICVSHCTLYRWYHQLCGRPRSIREAKGDGAFQT